MSVASVFWSKGQEIRDAERSLREREERFLDMDPREETDLGIHAKADAARLAVVLGRVQLIQAVGEQNSNRNLAATLLSCLALVLVMKSSDIFAALSKFLGL